MIRDDIKKILEKAVGQDAKVEYPASPEHGDYSSNVALVAKKNPEEVIAKIGESKMFEKVEQKDGFINFFIGKEHLQNQVSKILREKDRFGSLALGRGKKVQVEFISANPTGPLTLGNGRGGFCGDVLANVLEKAGYRVEREYYLNDRGEQIKKLGHSVMADEEAVYKGKYIEELAEKIKGRNAEAVGEVASQKILEEMIKPTVKKMGIEFDNWFSESSLYEKGKVDKALEELKSKGLTFEQEGALWFKSTKFGDDKDRVLVKKDGEKTYFAPDVAYTKDKFDRGFDKLIWFLGADHYGYIKRIQAVVEALGHQKEQAVFIVMQLVRLLREGKEVRMSKREGVYVTLDELIDEVGLDATRWFFLSRSPNSHLNFDLDLAKEQSDKNPVYYVQYAHARICSVLAKSGIRNPKSESLRLLSYSSELKLIKQLIKLPEVIEDTARDYQVQRLPKYVTDLATAFHKFYTDCRVIDEKEPELTQARLALASAVQIVLKNTLFLMGISAPEKM